MKQAELSNIAAIKLKDRGLLQHYRIRLRGGS
jgi:hypothetical protein